MPGGGAGRAGRGTACGPGNARRNAAPRGRGCYGDLDMEEEFGNGEVIMVIVSEVFLLDRVGLWVVTVKYEGKRGSWIVLIS